MIMKIVWNHVRLRPFSNILTLFAIAFCLGLLGGFWALSENLRILHATKAIEEGEMALFLDSNLSPERVNELQAKLKDFQWVDGIHQMSAEEAIKHLREQFGESLVSSLSSNSLPITLRIKMKGSVSDKELQSSIDKIKSWDSVVDADLGGELWSGQLSKSALSSLVSWSNLLLGVVFIVVILLISHITRIAFESSREDIETLTLMGASKRWIFAPLLLESCFIGILGSALGLILTILFLRFGLPPLSEILFGKITPISDLSWISLWKIVVLGIFASIFGAFLTWPLISASGKSP